MAVNITEQAIQPIVDLDTDVVVYVPGFAVKGPLEPTFVTRSTFTSLFGDLPYIFKTSQADTLGNSILQGSPDRSWLYAKGILDSGLTVLFHRQYPDNILVSKPDTYTNTQFSNPPTTAFAIGKGAKTATLDPLSSGQDENQNEIYKTISVKAKYKGSYYAGLKVTITRDTNGLMLVKVEREDNILESKHISLNPLSPVYIETVSFANIEFYETKGNGFRTLNLDQEHIGLTQNNFVYMSGKAELAPPIKLTGTGEDQTQELLSNLEDEVDIVEYINTLQGLDSPMEVLEDTEQFTSIAYITSGGYYQSKELAGAMQALAYKIKSIALVDLSKPIADGFESLQQLLDTTGSEIFTRAKSTSFVGADTYIIQGYKVVIPDSFGYLSKLGSNISQAIPYWIPVANNPNGVVSAVSTTRPVKASTRATMINNNGTSVNPIIYKQNVGYTIMGNRTLYPNEVVLGPQSFLNCQIVVNAVERSARRAAQDLLIVNTDPNTAFRKFKSVVSKTCDKFLVNGDGLAAYNIIKLKKTRPATIDTIIELTLREGIEEWNITVPYSLEM